MLINRINGATRVLGKSQGYLSLPVRDEPLQTVEGLLPSMTTSWQFNPREIEAINEGASLYIRIVGTGHPPILPYIGERNEVNFSKDLLTFCAHYPNVTEEQKEEFIKAAVRFIVAQT